MILANHRPQVTPTKEVNGYSHVGIWRLTFCMREFKHQPAEHDHTCA